MPKPLLQRCSPDSIQEFRLAAQKRYNDGLILAAQGRRTAAIYLWGYVIEMTLKAAYFSLIGKGLKDPITWGNDLYPAIQTAKAQGIAWPGSGAGHNVLAWAEWLILSRANQGQAYTSDFNLDIQSQAQRAYTLWRETLRYHKNVAYPAEVRQMNTAAEWFLANSRSL